MRKHAAAHNSAMRLTNPLFKSGERAIMPRTKDSKMISIAHDQMKIMMSSDQSFLPDTSVDNEESLNTNFDKKEETKVPVPKFVNYFLNYHDERNRFGMTSETSMLQKKITMHKSDEIMK